MASRVRKELDDEELRQNLWNPPLPPIYRPASDGDISGLIGDLYFRAIAPRRPRRGRPKMAEMDRRRTNPLHNASDEIDDIFYVLAELYPTKRKNVVMGRAIDIAAGWHNVDRTLLARHHSRPSGDRRKVRSDDE